MIGPMDEIGSERAPMGKAMVVHGLIETTVVIAKAAQPLLSAHPQNKKNEHRTQSNAQHFEPTWHWMNGFVMDSRG